MRTPPLAWANLTHDRVRFLLFLAGITFAVVLMFVQLGFRNALLDSNTQIHEKLRADLVLVSPSRQAIAMKEGFPRRRLFQAAAVRGVESVQPVYIENIVGFLRDTNPDPARREPTRAVRVIGVDPGGYALDLPELDPGTPRPQSLQRPGTAWFDRLTKSDPARPGQSIFGPLEPGLTSELTGQAIELTGSFALGSDFTTDGTLIVSDRTFLEILRRPLTAGAPDAEVDLGLVRLELGTDPDEAKEAIRRAVDTGERDPDVEVLTKEEYRGRERTFWLNNTPIGFAFGFGMAMGFVVGLVICYQILSGNVSDHLSEYGTLKAIGYTNLQLAWVVIQEALILAVAGFALGAAVSSGAYALLESQTGLPLRFTLDRCVWLFATTVAMCCLSGLVALVALFRADPADVF
jgi:putative ABC transport system permease protein